MCAWSRHYRDKAKTINRSNVHGGGRGRSSAPQYRHAVSHDRSSASSRRRSKQANISQSDKVSSRDRRTVPSKIISSEEPERGLRTSARIDQIRSGRRVDHATGPSMINDLSSSQRGLHGAQSKMAKSTTRPHTVARGSGFSAHSSNERGQYLKRSMMQNRHGADPTNVKAAHRFASKNRNTGGHVEKMQGSKAVIRNRSMSGSLVAKMSSFLPARIIASLLCLVIVVLAVYAIDLGINGNKIYQGVSIGEIDVSGLTKDEAIEQVSDLYAPRVASSKAVFYTSEENRQNPQNAENAENIEEQISYEESLENKTQWSVPSDRVEAIFDVNGIVEEAYQVGRDDGGILGRFQALFGGWHLDPHCSFNESTLSPI